MTLYALDDIDDALQATKAFLWPFEFGTWARLAIVMFFIGGVGGFNPFNFGGSPGGGGGGGGPGGPGTPGAPDVVPALGGAELAIVAAVVGIVVLIGLFFAIVGSIMEFVFVESLRRERVTIRRYWSEHWGDGLRLFAFRLVLGLVTLGILVAIGLAALGPALLGTAELSFWPVLIAIPVVLLLFLLAGIVNGFTTVFVVPVMVAEDRGVLSAWSRFWSTMRAQWKQYAVYLVMGFVLQIAMGIVSFIAWLVAAIAVAIPFAILGVIGAGLLSVSQIAGWAIIVVAVALLVLALIVLSLVVAVPIQSFLRYYGLFVLGDTDATLDLVAERRAAVRE